MESFMEKDGIIQFVGVNELTPEEQETIQQITTENYEKIATSLQNLTDLVVHVKTYNDEGKRKKYSFHIRCIAPTVIFESKKGFDWELARSLHKAFHDIIHQIEHKLHVNSSRPDRPR